MSNYTSTGVNTTLNINVPNDKVVKIGVENKVKIPPYQAWGKGSNYMREEKSIQTFDIVHILIDMTAKEKFCFVTIYDTIKASGRFEGDRYVMEYNVKPKLDKVNKTKFLEGYKLLYEKNIVKRVRRGIYTISPLLLIDTTGNQVGREQLWESIK